jgi:hypothetical protein
MVGSEELIGEGNQICQEILVLLGDEKQVLNQW